MIDVCVQWTSAGEEDSEKVPLPIVPCVGDRVRHPRDPLASLVVSERRIEPNRITCVCHVAWRALGAS